jgi:predicted nucleic acid-binding protein
VTFVDTSALYPLVAEDDDAYVAATDHFAATARDAGYLTHSYVLVEVVALVQRRLGMSAVRRLLDVMGPTVTVVSVDTPLHDAGVAALLSAGSRSVSLVDRVSFELMRRRGITEAFAFDDDFATAGFRLLPG